MRKLFYLILVVFVTTMCVVSCNRNKQSEAKVPDYHEPDPPVWTLNSDDVELGTTDFLTFDIELDYSKLNEKLHTDHTKKEYVENNKFDDEINITYNGDNAVVKCDNKSDFSIQTDGAHVTVNAKKDVALTLTGNSQNGSLKITGDKMVRINLKGVNLKNTKGPAINSQSKQPCFVVTDSSSVLSDDSTYTEAAEGEKQKGCICSRGYLAISGSAPLKIIANGADAIHSSKTVFVRRCSNIYIDSRAGNAIKAKSTVKIEGGVLNINSTGHGGHGITADDMVEICGGRTTIISNAGEGRDGKNSRGIKSDSIVYISGGIVRVKDSSVGGKGIRAGHKFHAKNCIVDVLTFGNDDKVTGSKNRAIKAVDEIRIDSSRVRVRTENGWNEGISCRSKIILNNSLIEVLSRDDAISAGDPETADIEVNNSRIYAQAGMDAIDSNGSIHVNSGLIFVHAKSRDCRAFDCDYKEFKVGPDAIIVGLGSITSKPTNDLLQHPMCFVRRPRSQAQFCLSTTGKNDNIVTFDVPKFSINDSITTFTIFLSVPEFKPNVSYDFCRRATVKPKHTFHGLLIGGTAQAKEVDIARSFDKNYTEF